MGVLMLLAILKYLGFEIMSYWDVLMDKVGKLSILIMEMIISELWSS